MTLQTPIRQPGHPVDPLFPARWSPRAFSDAALTEGQVKVLLEAARWAPSAANHQPWRLVWALRGEPGFRAILDGLVPFNREWAEKAAALIVVASKDRMTGRDGAEADNRWAAFDSGAAWMSLALQAARDGLAAHAMGGFDATALAAALGLPEGHSLQAVVAVGHPGQPESLPEPLRAREVPSPRLALEEIAFHGRF
ncbi:nitroreductase family protein [Rhodobacter sp. SGA-6-6]|uniref:nitroreductase family protein n=1 Tax=Rhodobacter sp. SGA-6-6 TaxID=2710882 RepID=UPI0013EBC14B|nr:nitroreductase family protein [Rhodobacter sp. SGA-6-6]NGM47798.1 nitroreductase family protein [Rhodobacter sp. SGA-6-6]